MVVRKAKDRYRGGKHTSPLARNLCPPSKMLIEMWSNDASL